MTAKFTTGKMSAWKMRMVRQQWIGWSLCALLLSSLLLPATAHAQSDPATPQGGLLVESRDGALHLQWQSGTEAASVATTTELTSYNGYLLPLQTVLVELPRGDAAASAANAVAVQGLSSSPYSGELVPAPVVQPPALDYVPTPTNTLYIEPTLPTAPVFVIAEGWQRGRHLAVIGFSPIYQDPANGQILSVESMSAVVAGARAVNDENRIDIALAEPNNAALFAPNAALATAPGPTNPLANTNAIKIFVSQAGVQQISGADLAAAGMENPAASKVRVFYQGVELPLHIIDNNSNNVVNAGDFVRFYAQTVGDAWNAQSVYWLTAAATDGKRMSARNVAAGSATARNTAYEVGRYQQSSIYETTLAGADGDNWFQANLRATDSNAAWDVTLPHQLPLNNALPTLLSLNLTIYPTDMSGYGEKSQDLKIATTGFSETRSISASLLGMKPYDDKIVDLSLGKASDAWTVTLLNESVGRAIMFDALDYLLPVQLNFNGQGATFQGIEETWRYSLSNTPTSVTGGRALYDITNPAEPQRLNIPGGANFQFQDGPEARRYVMTGNGTLFTPTLQAHTPVNLGGAGAAHTIYIAPKEFRATLQPLVDQRKAQGYQVRVVDVQAIYDSWSYGMVDAKAIRSFLRFAAGNWSPAPIAAILVGDGTWDPRNFEGYNNPNIIPPYVANVDPYTKYVPCESCFGQLDGDDPANDYLIDMWIGRFPVIDTNELTNVVNKIINYENATDDYALWRSVSLQIADDDVKPDNTIDRAGPFIVAAEHSVSLMPSTIRHLRNYFMAATDWSGASPALQSAINSLLEWFIDDPDDALQRSIDLMNSGVGLVTYTGHANHWFWARIGETEEESNPLFGLIEVRQLNNSNMPFISMSMTCWTSQFHKPAASHWTLDERLFLHNNGGAISTWGPTGFSIVPAHDALQAGFHGLLWDSPAQRAKLGALYEAGYLNVFASGRNFDVNKSFAVFGDPLTPARVNGVEALYMPKLTR